jgi:hypothetical protein
LRAGKAVASAKRAAVVVKLRVAVGRIAGEAMSPFALAESSLADIMELVLQVLMVDGDEKLTRV